MVQAKNGDWPITYTWKRERIRNVGFPLSDIPLEVKDLASCRPETTCFLEQGPALAQAAMSTRRVPPVS